MKQIRKAYQKKITLAVTAVQLNLDTRGLSFQKWGSEQHAKAGDWLVDNAGDIYTIDQAEFARTYEEISTGRFVKTAMIWASQAVSEGHVQTLEGTTAYKAGDYLIANTKEGDDQYAITQDKFESMYELVE